MASQQLVGRTGVVTSALRGGDKPGEARVVVEGIPHYYIAYSASPIPAGSAILVINNRGQRRIDVEPWSASLGAINDPPTNVEAM